MKITALLLLLALTGCATPITVLRHPDTGQVARCGGDATGSFVGGVIGYHMQKASDESCTRDYEALGFRRLGH